MPRKKPKKPSPRAYPKATTPTRPKDPSRRTIGRTPGGR